MSSNRSTHLIEENEMTAVSRKPQVWGYARVGSAETGNLQKLAIQTCEMTLAGVDFNHLLFDVSSANAADKPGFEWLIQSVKAGLVDEIMVTELDRMFRNQEDLLAFQKLLRTSHVKLRILNSSREHDGILDADFLSLEDRPHE